MARGRVMVFRGRMRDKAVAMGLITPRTKAQYKAFKKSIRSAKRIRKQAVEEKGAWWAQYNAYMRSEEWFLLRDKAMKRVGRMCERCRATKRLQVHHRTYIRLGHELLTDLEVLCFDCHMAKHPHRLKNDIVGSQGLGRVLPENSTGSVVAEPRKRLGRESRRKRRGRYHAQGSAPAASQQSPGNDDPGDRATAG